MAMHIIPNMHLTLIIALFKENEPSCDTILKRPECGWITEELEKIVQGYAISNVVPGTLKKSVTADWN